jgi:hypothetical protein
MGKFAVCSFFTRGIQIMRILVLLAASVSVIACSSQPQTASAPAASPAQARTQAHAAAGGSTKTAGMTPNGVRIPYGYKLVVKDGQELYCHKETILGSRFPQTVCLDEQGLKELEARGESARDSLNRGQETCAGSSCGGG